jgi:hypothetical protein
MQMVDVDTPVRFDTVLYWVNSGQESLENDIINGFNRFNYYNLVII